MSSKSREIHRILGFFDGWFIPMAFGVLTVFVCIQLLGFLPGVRAAMDKVEGRLSVQPATVPPTAVQSDSAVVTLTVDSLTSALGVEVLVNGRSLGNFTTNQMRITVREGDQIQFVDSTGDSVSISVDTDSDKLLLPAPGQSIQLDDSTRQAFLPAAEFM
ncbi:hypothetical protein [Alicyclobacillus dauci]|uniref:DUF4115 domain-containing protein n=1 Tax=Alicyclobacillus dauci TaxID=1475485 RepID=A0ABY6YXX4_9BACL|nr:hypothetical protein [Alicyclobacillus dauci]WAH35088.1 hypothetical protein NZD86_12210 [Alicyclobacillus dauci]